MSLCFSILQALPAFYVHTFVCTVYVKIVKIPEFLAVSIDVMAGRTPGHRTIERITPFLPWQVALLAPLVCMLAACVSNLLWGAICFLVGVTCLILVPLFSPSSSPPLRGRPDDGSHAPDILAPGELWVLHLFLWAVSHWKKLRREGSWWALLWNWRGPPCFSLLGWSLWKGVMWRDGVQRPGEERHERGEGRGIVFCTAVCLAPPAECSGE